MDFSIQPGGNTAGNSYWSSNHETSLLVGSRSVSASGRSAFRGPRYFAAANRGLALTQTGNDPDNSLFTTKSGRVQLLTSLAITNISDRDMKVNDIQVALPFDATDFHWIQPPAGATNHQYELPALGECPFEASEVLNSRLGRKFLIHSGRSVDGLLLGEAQVALPPTFRHGSTMPIELTVFADKGRRYAIVIILRVERHDQKRKPTDRLPSRPLLEPGEHDELNAPTIEPVLAASAMTPAVRSSSQCAGLIGKTLLTSGHPVF
jgi:hypothetical protein